MEQAKPSVFAEGGVGLARTTSMINDPRMSRIRSPRGTDV
jgi:hypothetical protein